MIPALLMTNRAGPGAGRAVLRLVLGGVGGAAAVATVLGFLGTSWWALDLLANFRVQYLLVLAVTGALYTLFVGRAIGGALLAAAAVNLVAVAPMLLASPAAAATGSPELDVIAFNVQAANRDRAPVIEWLGTQDADLVFLLESTFEWENAVARAIDFPYRVVTTVPDRYTFGITLLARHGVDPAARGLVFGGRPVVEATVPLGAEQVKVLAVHPRSPTSADGTADRNEHLDAAAVWARARTGPVALVGDLNASPWSAAFRRLVEDGDLDNSLAGHGLQPTWPAGWGPLMIPIDHALHSEDLAVVARATGPALGSDHRPVLVTFAFREG